MRPGGPSASLRPRAQAPARKQLEVARGRRRWLRGMPRAFWLAMAVAFLNALAWGLITPYFQGPDEPVHIGYAQYVGETGRVPRPRDPYYHPSRDAEVAFNQIPWSLTGHPSWSTENSRLLKRELAAGLGRVSEGGAGYIGANPPLYYYLEAVPYRLALGGSFLDRLFAMRLLSALLAGLTTGFVFLFMRELMPRTRWAWALGALVVAFQPLFGFIGGTVNNDNLLWVASAWLFWLIARAFNRGLTPRIGAGIGAALVTGMLAKSSMFGLLPGAALVLGVLVWRSSARRHAILAATIAVATAAVPFVAWLAINQLVFKRPGATTTGGFTSIDHTTLSGQLSYLWQFYAPRLPFMHHIWFTHYPKHPLWDTYLQGFVGRFGWFAFGFPSWANLIGAAIAATVVGFAVAALVRLRAALHSRWMELFCYSVMALGVALLVNVAGYRYYIQTGIHFEQTRYLFPALTLYAALVAVAAKGAGRRFGPLFAGVFLLLAIADSALGQLLTIAHYFS